MSQLKSGFRTSARQSTHLPLLYHHDLPNLPSRHVTNQTNLPKNSINRSLNMKLSPSMLGESGQVQLPGLKVVLFAAPYTPRRGHP